MPTIANGPFLSSQAASVRDTETNLLFRVAQEKAVGCSAQPRKQSVKLPSLLTKSLSKSVAKSFSLLSPVSINGQNWHFPGKKKSTCFLFDYWAG